MKNTPHRVLLLRQYFLKPIVQHVIVLNLVNGRILTQRDIQNCNKKPPQKVLLIVVTLSMRLVVWTCLYIFSNSHGFAGNNFAQGLVASCVSLISYCSGCSKCSACKLACAVCDTQAILGEVTLSCVFWPLKMLTASHAIDTTP